MPMISKLRRHRRDPEGAMTLIEHLEELRYRLIVAFVAIAVGAAVGWFLYPPVVHLLREPYCATIHQLPKANRPPGPGACPFYYQGAIDPVLVKLKIVVFLGLALALPVVLYQLWAFIVPGLTKHERRLAVPFIASSMVLFALGVFVAYLTLPKALRFLFGFAGEGFSPLLTGDKFLGFVVLVGIAFGLSFELPILLIFLGLAGVLSSRRLRDWRRYSILGIAIFAAVITPSSDPYSMLAMMIPMVLFYEAAIIVLRLMKH
jgi:sec-independent protein translocase protein TatC